MVRILGSGSPSSAQRHHGVGCGRAVAFDQLQGGKAHLGVRVVQLGDHPREGFAARGAEGSNRLDRALLHPPVGVVEQAAQVREQAVVAGRRVGEDVDRSQTEVRGMFLEQTADRGHRRAGAGQRADGGEERGLDLGVGVAQAGGQRRHGTGSRRAELSECQSRTPAHPRVGRLDGAEEPGGRGRAELGQGLRDRIDPAGLVRQGAEQERGRARPELAKQVGGGARDAVVPGRQERGQRRGQARQQRSPLDEEVDRGPLPQFIRIPEGLVEDRQQHIVGHVASCQCPDGRRPDLWRRIAAEREHGLVHPVDGRGEVPEGKNGRGAGGGVGAGGGGNERFDRGRADSPEGLRRLAPEPFAPVAEQGDQVGDRRRGSGPDPAEAIATSARTLSLRCFNSPRRPSTAG